MKVKFNNLFITRFDKKFVPSSQSEGWKYYEWRCFVQNEVTHQSMEFSVYGGSAVKNISAKEALFMILRDVVDYINVGDIGEFMDEFGYTSYKEAKKIYDALEKSFNDCMRVLGDEEEIFKYYNSLEKKYN